MAQEKKLTTIFMTTSSRDEIVLTSTKLDIEL